MFKYLTKEPIKLGAEDPVAPGTEIELADKIARPLIEIGHIELAAPAGKKKGGKSESNETDGAGDQTGDGTKKRGDAKP